MKTIKQEKVYRSGIANIGFNILLKIISKAVGSQWPPKQAKYPEKNKAKGRLIR